MSSSFGQALVESFNGTFRTVTSARLQNEQAAALRQEREGNERQQREVRESQIRNGILNPDGTTNDPGGNAQRAQLQAPAVQGPLVNPQAPAQAAPASPPVQGTPAVAAPAPAPAAPAPAATQAPAPSPMARAATPAPAAAPPAQAPQGGSPQGAVAQQGALAQQGGAPAPGGQTFEPIVPPEVIQQASAVVERRGNEPVDAMIVAPYTIPDPARGPGGQGTQAQAAQYAPQLTQEVAQHRGAGETGPLTRANWNAYLRDVTLASQRNLSPQAQVQALAVVDRIRTAGLQRFTALAVSAAQAGDMQGAARALNGASNFNPDGFQDTFTATQGGIQMQRRPEPGVQGEPQNVTVPAAEVVRYATAMLDPTWSLNHFLNVDKHNETMRANRAREGLTAAGIAESRAARAERRGEARTNADNDAAVLRASRDLERARAAYDEVSRNGGESGGLAAARLAVERAQQAMDAAEERGGARAINMAGALEERAAARRGREGNQRTVSEQDITAFRTATDEIRDEGARGWARANGRAYLSGTPGVDASAIPDILARAYTRMTPEVRANPPARIRDEATGVTLTLPQRAGSAPQSRPQGGGGAGGGSELPPAPTERGSMGGARTPPPPAPSPMVTPPRLGTPGAATAPLPMRTPRPDRTSEALDSAVRMLNTPQGRRLGVDGVARTLGVDAAELRRRAEGAR